MEIKITCDTKLSVALENLLPFQGELKTLSEVNYQKLKKQILEEGFCAPVFVWKNDGKYYLCDGHQRTITLNKMKDEGYKVPDVPAVEIQAKTKREAKKKLLSYVSQFGKVDPKGLYQYILDAELTIEDMDDFEIPEIDMDSFKEEFFPEDQPEGAGNEDNVPEVAQNELGVELGDIYQLGEHRLMCGDSTDLATVEKLMDGEKADMVFTDPPYGISYKNNMSKKFEMIENDDSFLTEWVKIVPKVSTGFVFIWTAWKVLSKWVEITAPLGKMTNVIVWDKGGGGLGDLEGAFATDYELAIVYNRGEKLEGKRIGSVWSIGKDNGASYVHPTQKPVALAEQAFDSCIKSRAKVLDLFGGSGSTLIACEKTNRKCFMMELDPHYCSVIIKRWEEYTGKKHKKLS